MVSRYVLVLIICTWMIAPQVHAEPYWKTAATTFVAGTTALILSHGAEILHVLGSVTGFYCLERGIWCLCPCPGPVLKRQITLAGLVILATALMLYRTRT